MSLKKTGAALFVILLIVVAAPRAASAATITLTAVNGNLYQQGVQNPCIFANDSCQQPAGFPATDLPNGAVSGYDATSTYTVSQLLPYLNGGSLEIGLDINQANTAQTLTSFTMSIGGVVTDTYSGSTGNVPAGNQGNGYADYLLTNFSSLDGLSGDTLISFHFVFSNANDGTENLFLVSGLPTPPTAVPEPASMLLLGTGLMVAARARRRKVS